MRQKTRKNAFMATKKWIIADVSGKMSVFYEKLPKIAPMVGFERLLQRLL